MSTWWRACRVCGALGDDVRRCSYCGEFLPYSSMRDDGADWRLLGGVVVLMGLGLVAIIALALVLQVTGGRP